jgi:alcohol dehydrogenase
MKAIQLQEPQKLCLIDVDEPAGPGAGQALVRTHCVGICGTDTSAYLGKFPLYIYPRIPGHELGVEVLEVGADVTHIAAGDRCSVEPYMHCGDCHACRKGATNCCANLKVLGVMIDGGLRSRFVVPAVKLHRAEDLSYEQLALVETLAIGCHAVNRASPQPGENCLVIGAGPIGLSTIEFVKLTGARTIVLDLNPQRLDFCRQVMQVEETILTGDNVETDLRRVGGGDLPDVVIDATGNSQSMSGAFHLLAPTGRLVFVGITTDEVRFRHVDFHRPEGTLLCSRNALPGDFTRIIELIQAGRIDTRPWITGHLAFDEVIEKFPTCVHPEAGALKTIIDVV